MVARGLGEEGMWVVTANGYRVGFFPRGGGVGGGGRERVMTMLKLVVMVAKPYEYTKNHCFGHF